MLIESSWSSHAQDEKTAVVLSFISLLSAVSSSHIVQIIWMPQDESLVVLSMLCKFFGSNCKFKTVNGPQKGATLGGRPSGDLTDRYR